MTECASKLVSGAILGLDVVAITVGGKRYEVRPPTIYKIAGASYYLSGIGEGRTIREVIMSINKAPDAARALSCLIAGDTSLYEELSRGTFNEIVDGLDAAYSLISAENFIKLSALAKSAANLTAKQKL